MMWTSLKIYIGLLVITLQTYCDARRMSERKEPPECYHKVTDVVFALDSSVSLWESDFRAQIQFVQRLVDSFDIGQNNVRVGVITFGSQVRLDFTLAQHHTKKGVKSAIEKITALTGMQGTNTGSALEYARTTMFSEENGGRSTSHKVIILITDGYSQNATKTMWEASTAHSYDIEIFAIGVGLGSDDKELRFVASKPRNKHVFKVDSFVVLHVIEEALENMVCERPSNDQQVLPTGNPTANVCGGKPADVYFLLDSSSSIWKPDFYKQLDFVKSIVSTFDLGENKTRVGVVTFSDGIHPVIPLTGSRSHHELEDLIDSVPYTAGGTSTGAAISYLTNHGFTKEVSRPDVAHVAILLTDGQSRDLQQTVLESHRAHKAGIHIFAIGIGQDVDESELKEVASDPDEDFMFKIDDHRALSTISDLLVLKACQVPGNLPKDEPDTCRFDEEIDLMFLFDSSAIGRRHSHVIEHVISDVVRDMNSKHHAIRVGILRDNRENGQDISLSQFQNAYSFRRDMKHVEYKGLQPLVQRMRRYSFKQSRGGRKLSQKVAVVFVDSKLDNPGKTIQETRRARFSNIRIIVVAIGDHYDEKQLHLMVSAKPARNIVYVDSYKSLIGAKGTLLSALCLR